MTDENTRMPSDSVVEALRFWNEQSLAWMSTRYDHAKPGWMEVAIAKGTAALQALAAQPRDDVREAADALDSALGGMLTFYGMDYDHSHDTQRVVHASAEKAREQYRTALSQTDEQSAIPDMTDAECATAYRDLRKRANDAGFATVGEWIDEQESTQ